jgi:hypothetical protein
MIGHPWIAGMEVPLHAQVSPIDQLLFDVFAHGFGLQAERMAAQVNTVLPVLALGKQKRFR